MAAASNPLCCFWKPQKRVVAPQESAAAVVRVAVGWSSLSYPGLSAAVAGAPRPQALSLQQTLGGVVTSRGRQFLVSRNLFLVLAVLTLAYGVVQAAFQNEFAVVPLAMSVFWAMMTRVMANRLVKELSAVESTYQRKMSEIGHIFLGGEWTLSAGTAMQWVAVSRSEYSPPQVDPL